MAAKKDTSAMDFILATLKKSKKASYAEVKAAADEKAKRRRRWDDQTVVASVAATPARRRRGGSWAASEAVGAGRHCDAKWYSSAVSRSQVGHSACTYWPAGGRGRSVSACLQVVAVVGVLLQEVAARVV
jgi:hypothetical protein